MKKFLILLIIAIFAIPLSSILPTQYGGGWYVQYLMLIFFGFLAAGFVLWDFDKFLSLFYIYCLLSTFFITGVDSRAVILLFNFSIFSLIAYGISKLPFHYKKYIFRSICVLTLIQLAWIGVQLLNKDPFFHNLYNPLKDSPVGSIGSPNQTGIFFALTIPVMMYVFPLLGLLSFAGIIISKSSFSFMAAVVSGMVYLFFINREYFITALTVISVIGVLFFWMVDVPRMVDFKTRFSVWNYAVKSTVKGNIKIERGEKIMQYKTNPLYGYGFSRFLTIFPYVPNDDTKGNFNYVNEKFTHAHNDYVEYFFEGGWTGLSLMLAMIGSFIVSFIRVKKTKEIVTLFCALLAFLICASGNFLMQMAVPGMFLAVFYGLYKGAIRNGEITRLV